MYKITRKTVALLVAIYLCFLGVPAFAANPTDEAVLGNNRWSVDSSGDFLPNANTYSIGSETQYPASIWVNGEEYTSFAAGTDGNWEDLGTTVVLDRAATKFIATIGSGNWFATGLTAGSGDITLENGQVIDGGTNNAFKFTENSDTLSFTASGNDWVIDSTDGGVIFTLTDGTDGTVDFMTNNDADDYIQISTSGNQPLINFVGCNGSITAASGAISFGDENISTTGTLGAGATTVTSLIIGDETLARGTDDIFTMSSNDSAMTLKIISGGNDTDAVLYLVADKDDNAEDDWYLTSVASDNTFTISNAAATMLTLSGAGLLTTTGDVVIAGTTPLLTIGDGGDEDAGIQINSDTNDFYIASENSADDLIIGSGSSIGTNPIISMTDAGVTTITGSTDGVLTVWGAGESASDAFIRLVGDAQADVNDSWQIWNDSSAGTLYIGSDSAESGTYATKLSLAGATGNLTMAGDVLTLGDGEVISNAVDDTVLIQSNDASLIVKLYSPNESNGTVSLQLVGDAQADVNDSWQVQATASGTLTVASDPAEAGTFVTKLTIAGADGDITTTGDIEIVDDMDLVFGTDADWKVQYDEGVDDQLLFITAGTGCTATDDPMFEILVGATPTADQQVFGIGKGAQASNTALFTVDEDGDAAITGTTTLSGALSAGYEAVTTSSADPGVGVASVSKLYTAVTTDDTGASADAVSLAAGMAGQLKIVKLVADTEAAGLSLTANYAGDSTAILFEDVNDLVVLVSDGTEWHIILNTGGTVS